MLRIFILVFLTLYAALGSIYCQNDIKNNFSIKLGHSLSVTQWGLSPLSETRRLEDRSINDVFFNIQYAFKLKKNRLNCGIQFIQKGFKTNYERKRVNNKESVYYEHRLFYMELPINYEYVLKKNSFIGGIVFSYLYDDIWRFSDIQTFYDNIGNINTIYNSNYSQQFPFYDRYNVIDFGVSLGYARKINNSLSFEFVIQKHFINVDNWNTLDLRYNLCFLTGIRYKPF